MRTSLRTGLKPRAEASAVAWRFSARRSQNHPLPGTAFSTGVSSCLAASGSSAMQGPRYDRINPGRVSTYGFAGRDPVSSRT